MTILLSFILIAIIVTIYLCIELNIKCDEILEEIKSFKKYCNADYPKLEGKD